HRDTPIERYMRQVQHSLYEKGYNQTMEELRILAPDITCLEDFFGYDPENSPFVYDSSTEDAINPGWPPLATPRQELPDTEAPKSKSKKKPNKRQRQRQREAVPSEEPPRPSTPTLPESQPNEEQQRKQGAITRSHARKTKQVKLCDKYTPPTDSVPDPTPPEDDGFQEVGHRHARRRRPASPSTKTTATSEPARSSKIVATTQPPTSSNNVEQAKEVEVEELPSKPPTSANTPVHNRLKSEIADLTLKIKKLQDFVNGRRHVNTVPVKLIRPSNSLRKEHEDTHFCAGQIKHIRDLAELLGPQAVNVLSVDDKARVPLGLPAAQKQAAILMRYERQILMPDHDYLIAKGLKLIPSVIGVLCFKDWKVSYSGPTCISIRGGAIDSSIASRQDARLFLVQQQDQTCACGFLGRWSRRSAKKREGFTSCGKILQNAELGRHVRVHQCTSSKCKDSCRENTREENFEAAGRILAEVWDRTVVDGFEVIAQYVPPASTAASESTEANDVLWRDRHILQSKYCLQVVKCQDESGCSPMISRLRLYLEDGFLPAPVMFRHGLYGLEACSQENMDGRFLDISQRLQNASLVPVKPCPNDYYCSSVIPELQKLICPVCKKYFFRKASLTKHGKIHKNLATIFELAEEEIETEVVSSIDEGGVQIIEDMEAWMQPI
ncbi:hypothetical protein ILUMI_02498, partial [Ignelater luminosus]